MNNSRPTVPIILDVDTGIDDAMALAFGALCPSADFVAVTTVVGNAGIAATTQNTLDVLDFCGSSSTPVHQGASRPLVRQHVNAAHVHGTNGVGEAELPRSERKLGADKGPAAIIRLAKSRPGELTLVCVGPLTNLAIALNVAPELPDLLKRLVIMGGAVRTPGNITSGAEFNFYVDPEAADQVLQAPFPDLFLIGLDVTHKCVLTKSTWEQATSRDKPAAKLTRQVLRERFDEQGLQGAYMHDPLALGVALDPALVETVLRNARVGTGEEDRGVLVLEEGDNVQVAMNVDSERFMNWFLGTLGLAG